MLNEKEAPGQWIQVSWKLELAFYISDDHPFRYSVDHLPAGNYAFRVLAVSLAGPGAFTDYHDFRIVEIDNSISRGWIILSVVAALLLACTATVSFYYKHKIATLLRRQDDNIVLLQDIQPTDFNELSRHHGNDFNE